MNELLMLNSSTWNQLAMSKQIISIKLGQLDK